MTFKLSVEPKYMIIKYLIGWVILQHIEIYQNKLVIIEANGFYEFNLNNIYRSKNNLSYSTIATLCYMHKQLNLFTDTILCR